MYDAVRDRAYGTGIIACKKFTQHAFGVGGRLSPMIDRTARERAADRLQFRETDGRTACIDREYCHCATTGKAWSSSRRPGSQVNLSADIPQAQRRLTGAAIQF